MARREEQTNSRTDNAAQEHELLCRAMDLELTFDQLQGAELSCPWAAHDRARTGGVRFRCAGNERAPSKERRKPREER